LATLIATSSSAWQRDTWNTFWI